MSTELTVVNPGTLMTQATDVAGVCKQIVTRTAQSIQGRKYVRVEGWQSIAAAYGCVASAINVEVLESGIRATGELRRVSDGAVIATAEGFVGNDENTWKNRPEYAKRAMAQTRAISRVCRSAFAFVVVLIDADLSTTPAEEMIYEHEPQGADQRVAGDTSSQAGHPLASAVSGAPAGPALSPSQERLIRAKLKDAGLTDTDFAATYPAWSLTPKDGKALLPKAEVNAVLAWIEERKVAA